jgi:DNA-binding NarL/FixJ family response regulator
VTIVGKQTEVRAAEPDVPRARLLAIVADEQDRRLIGAVLGDAGQTPEAVLTTSAGLADHRIDEATVILLACDIERPGDVTALRALSRSTKGAAIIVVSPRSTATAVRRTLDAGGDALVFEPDLVQALVPTIRAVESGQSAVPRTVRAGFERPNLSHRERQVLSLVCQGLTNAGIAESLVLAESTIKSHMASIFTKFGVHSRKEAVAAYADLTAAIPDAPAAEECRS